MISLQGSRLSPKGVELSRHAKQKPFKRGWKPRKNALLSLFNESPPIFTMFSKFAPEKQSFSSICAPFATPEGDHKGHASEQEDTKKK